MRRPHDARQSGVLVDVDGDHQVEPQQREVGEIVLRQFLAAEVRVDAAQATEAVGGDTSPLQVRQLNAARVPDDDVLDVAFTVDQRADLAASFVREFGQLTRELGRHDLLRRNSTRVEFFNATQLIRFQPLRVAVYGADLCNPPWLIGEPCLLRMRCEKRACEKSRISV